MWPSAWGNQNRIESQGEIAQTWMSLQEGIGGAPDPHSLMAADCLARLGQTWARFYFDQCENVAAPRHKIDFAEGGSKIAGQYPISLQPEPPSGQGLRPLTEGPGGAASFPAHGLPPGFFRSAKARA